MWILLTVLCTGGGPHSTNSFAALSHASPDTQVDEMMEGATAEEEQDPAPESTSNSSAVSIDSARACKRKARKQRGGSSIHNPWLNTCAVYVMLSGLHLNHNATGAFAMLL